MFLTTKNSPNRSHTARGRTRQSNVPSSSEAASCRGFTLIEVIIAIGILAVMMTINYRILRGIVEAKREIDYRREGMYIANSTLTRMS
jgi:prepilin-type N-terminal cleavage/methylation domain-containing protein